MCISPLRIKNPNYDPKFVQTESKFLSKKPLSESERVALFGVSSFKNKHSTYIEVPCGKCPECRFVRQNEFVQRTFFESIGCYTYMVTLTYCDEFLPSLVVDGKEESLEINYCNFSHISNLFKRIRVNAERQNLYSLDYNLAENVICNEAIKLIRYAFVSERGSKRHRPHFHGILFIPRVITIKGTDYNVDPYILEGILRQIFPYYFSINVGTRKAPVYRKLFKLKRKYVGGHMESTFDLHYVQPNQKNDNEDVVYYLSKYVVKEDPYMNALHDKVFAFCKENDIFDPYDIWRIVRNRIVTSKNYGLGNVQNVFEVNKYLVDCIHTSLDLKRDRPMFYNYDGKEHPLSHYYVSKCSVFGNTNGRRFNLLEELYPFHDKPAYITDVERYGFYFNSESRYMDYTIEEEDDIELERFKKYINYNSRLKNISPSISHID